jgi:hypothetical protein
LKIFLKTLNILFIGILSSCNPVPIKDNAVTTPSQAVSVTTIQPSAYPIASPETLVVTESGYPGISETPTSSYFVDRFEIPQPGENTGVIIGKLVEAGTSEPYLGAQIVLGPVSYSDNPEFPPLVGFSLESDPIAIQATDGSFLFDDVAPGNYGLVLFTPLSQALVSKPGSDDTLIFEVNANQVVDLGELLIR